MTPSDRARDTAAPLARARGITPEEYDPLAYPALVARVRGEAGPALIVGHSNTVPDIVATLGGTKPGPLAHPDFGDIWTVTPAGTRRGRVEP